MADTTVQIDPEGVEPQTLVQLTGPLTGKRILEVGCGDGRVTRRYAADAGSVVAIDPKAEGIAEAKKRNRFAHVRFEMADIFDFTDPKPFDIVLFSWCL